MKLSKVNQSISVGLAVNIVALVAMVKELFASKKKEKKDARI